MNHKNENTVTRALRLVGDDNEASATTNSIDTKDERMVIAGAAWEINKTTMEIIDQRVVIEGVTHALAGTKKRHKQGGAAIKRNDSLNSRSMASNATLCEERVYPSYTDGTDLTYEEGDDDDEESALFSTIKSEDSSDEDESTLGSDRSESETAINSLLSAEESTTSSQKEIKRQTRVAENLYKANIEKKLRAAHNEACKNLKVSTSLFFHMHVQKDRMEIIQMKIDIF